MKKQKKKVSIKVRDREPLKNVTGGRRRHHASQAGASASAERGNQVGEGRGSLGPFGLNRPQ
jgi:hypothetical protein